MALNIKRKAYQLKIKIFGRGEATEHADAYGTYALVTDDGGIVGRLRGRITKHGKSFKQWLIKVITGIVIFVAGSLILYFILKHINK